MKMGGGFGSMGGYGGGSMKMGGGGYGGGMPVQAAIQSHHSVQVNKYTLGGRWP